MVPRFHPWFHIAPKTWNHLNSLNTNDLSTAGSTTPRLAWNHLNSFARNELSAAGSTVPRNFSFQTDTHAESQLSEGAYSRTCAVSGLQVSQKVIFGGTVEPGPLNSLACNGLGWFHLPASVLGKRRCKSLASNALGWFHLLVPCNWNRGTSALTSGCREVRRSSKWFR